VNVREPWVTVQTSRSMPVRGSDAIRDLASPRMAGASFQASLIIRVQGYIFARQCLTSNGSLYPGGSTLVHPAFQYASCDLLRSTVKFARMRNEGGIDVASHSHYIYDSSPTRIRVSVNRIEQCLADCLKKVFRAKVWFP
jgi:hypothetical protein